MKVTAENVQAGHRIHNDYSDGSVTMRNEHGIEVRWDADGNDTYTWEEVAEYGFTFS